MLDRRALALTVLCFTFPAAAEGPPTVAEAEAFLTNAEQRLLQLSVEMGRADWVKVNFITEDTELLAARADERQINAAVELAKQSVRFDKLSLPETLARKMRLLKNGLTLATPSDPKESEQLTRIASSMEGLYGKGKYCRKGTDGKEECRDLEELSKVLANSRDYDELLDAWAGWHAISRPMRKDYVTYVALANKGARELGFADTGAMWRSKYDMPPDAFASELDRLWEQVKPLYLSLHAYVRAKLREKYGDRVPASGPDSRASPRQHVGAGVGKHLPARGAGRRRPRIRPDADPQEPQDERSADGEVRRGVLHVPRLRAAARDVLEAVAVPEATRSRRRLSRERVGHRPRERRADQDVHRASRPRTSTRSITSWATTSTSARTTSSRTSSATAPTTASTRPSATRSPFRSRRNTS